MLPIGWLLLTIGCWAALVVFAMWAVGRILPSAERRDGSASHHLRTRRG